MSRLDKTLLTAAVITIASGVGLHFLFDLWPSILTEFIAPVNESLWEHIKLVFWPYLVAGLYLTGKGKWKTAPWLLSLLILCALLLAGGWVIYWKLGGSLALDIAWYFIVMGLGFLLPLLLPVPDRWTELLMCVLIVLAGLIICWTIDPPNTDLFHDLSLIDTFYRLDC